MTNGIADQVDEDLDHRALRAAETSEAAVGTGYDFAVQHHFAALVSPAARMLAGKAPARGKRADQRHFAILILFEADNTRQRLAGNIVGVDAEHFGELGRK